MPPDHPYIPTAKERAEAFKRRRERASHNRFVLAATPHIERIFQRSLANHHARLDAFMRELRRCNGSVEYHRRLKRTHFEGVLKILRAQPVTLRTVAAIVKLRADATREGIKLGT
jgi:hypothetical protein